MDYWGGQLLATEWALLTLEKSIPEPPVLGIYIDIKPQWCPKPPILNRVPKTCKAQDLFYLDKINLIFLLVLSENIGLCLDFTRKQVLYNTYKHFVRNIE